MKKVAGTLKLDQAQYRELEAFSKFGSDLDAATMAVLNKGSRNVEILKQDQYKPMTVEKQIAIIYCGTRGWLNVIPTEKIRQFEVDFLNHLESTMPELLDDLKKGSWNDDMDQKLELSAKEVVKRFVVRKPEY
jgi:F-type H+/Na+-transporting ATPase subunit alpha